MGMLDALEERVIATYGWVMRIGINEVADKSGVTVRKIKSMLTDPLRMKNSDYEKVVKACNSLDPDLSKKN
jgi:hypothetical protein